MVSEPAAVRTHAVWERLLASFTYPPLTMLEAPPLALCKVDSLDVIVGSQTDNLQCLHKCYTSLGLKRLTA